MDRERIFPIPRRAPWGTVNLPRTAPVLMFDLWTRRQPMLTGNVDLPRTPSATYPYFTVPCNISKATAAVAVALGDLTPVEAAELSNVIGAY